MNDECESHNRNLDGTISETTHMFPCALLWPHLEIFTYPIIRNAIIVIITVTSISNAVLIIIFLSRVRQVGAVVLKNRKHNQTFRNKYNYTVSVPYYFNNTYLFAVVGGILHTNQVSVGPSIQICVLSTDVAIASIAGFALAAEHGISKVAEVVTAGVFVAVVASIEAGIAGCTHLEGEWELNSLNSQ